jgi:hypothetical protein
MMEIEHGLGDFGCVHEAIDTFSVGVARWPQDARFLRHRGHRWLSAFESTLAARDLERA